MAIKMGGTALKDVPGINQERLLFIRKRFYKVNLKEAYYGRKTTTEVRTVAKESPCDDDCYWWGDWDRTLSWVRNGDSPGRAINHSFVLNRRHLLLLYDACAGGTDFS